MKRNKKENLKEDYIQIKLTAKEKQILKENADKCGMSISQYIRTLCIYD